MGGVLVNGCGASDSYYPMRAIGTFYCQKCRREQMFSLTECRMKIRVLYIPTVSIKTRYAVACNACHFGYYVDETQKNDILCDRVIPEIGENVLYLHKVGTEAETKPQEPKPVPEQEQKFVQEQNIQPVSEQEKKKPVFCSKCGSRLDLKTGRCPACDPEPAEERTETREETKKEKPVVPDGRDLLMKQLNGQLKKKICPSCGLLYSYEKTVCPLCGGALVERE